MSSKLWGLDRIASHNNSQISLPPTRPYSPAPRRSNLGSQRPQFTPRDSTLSLISASTSYTSLPASARISSVKRQTPVAPPPDVEDPLAALERIVGKPLHVEDTTQSIPLKPDTFDAQIAFVGLSLQQYVDLKGINGDGEPLQREHSQHFVEEYGKEKEKFEDLHKSITACDEVLQSVEKYLSSFQADLGALSTEIETLQSRSTALNERLENRRKVEKILGPTVDRITLSSSFVKKISEGAIDETWVRTIEELQDRSTSLESAIDLKDINAVRDLKPLIEDLTNKAIERIRDYFASQIRSLRAPNINAQVIQYRAFLRFQPLYTFLAKKQPQLAEEITQAYANTMRWYYHAHFTRYLAALSTLRIYATDKHDVLGEDPVVASKGRTASSAPKTDNFSIARRLGVLRSPSTTALPSHTAEESKATHHIETPFLALNLALVDNASFEYTFMNSFFSSQSFASPATTSNHFIPLNHGIITRHFQTIFAPVIAIASGVTKSILAETYDALGVLLMVRLNQQLAFTLQKRKVPTLDSYINGTNMLLWPRFQSILDANSVSLKHLTASLPSRPSGTTSAAGTLATLSGSSSSGPASTAPHPVTNRFANLVKGIIDLSSEAGDDEPISNSLARLRGEYEAFLVKLGSVFGISEKGRRDKARLMGNNYALVLAIIGETKGKLATETRTKFQELQADVASSVT